MIHILVVEDDKEINQLLCKMLQSKGYQTVGVTDGLSALQKVEEHSFELVLLDLMLPYKSGDEFLAEFRRRSDIPVIVISAKSTVQSKVDLLHLGADDYITKPFDLSEVLARVETQLRKQNKESLRKQVLVYKDIVFDEECQKIVVNNTEIVLTHIEYEILHVLMKNPKRLYSKASLFELVWNEEFDYECNTIHVHISSLRSKLKKISPSKKYIETVYGMGYRLFQI